MLSLNKFYIVYFEAQCRLLVNMLIWKIVGKRLSTFSTNLLHLTMVFNTLSFWNVFLAVRSCENLLKNAGFKELLEQDDFEIHPGLKYYIKK